MIIPFHRGLTQLEASVRAARAAAPEAELVIVADGSPDDCGPLADRYRARVLSIAGPNGPAVARNRGVAVALGDIFVFIDSDVVVAQDAIARLCRHLVTHSDVAAVFGAYDEAPREPNFMSRYKNLSHSYVHQVARQEATTFWAGLGAVRAAAFREIGGFHEALRRPCIEDIELGYRLVERGYRIHVVPEARGCHLKRWTLWGSVVSDIRDRGVPWTQLILANKALANDLNTTTSLRLSLVLAYVIVFGAVAALIVGDLWMVVALALAGLLTLNWSYYRWFKRQQGLWFAARVVPAHVLHHLCNGVSLVAGAALLTAGRRGLKPPGVLPLRKGQTGTSGARGATGSTGSAGDRN